MYVCICRGITERDIHRAAHQGICSWEQLSKAMGVGDECGTCSSHARQVLDALSQKISICQTQGIAPSAESPA